MSSVALLVDCLKIITWLEDRKKLRKDWYNYLKAGEEKLKLLLKDKDWTISYPAIHQHITLNEQIFNVTDIGTVVDLLLASDLASQKNLLFGYSDKRVKEWTALKKYMEGNHLALLNLAKFIEQSLRFDLYHLRPGLNKSVESYDSQLTVLKRKIDFNNNTIFQQVKGLQKERVLFGVDSDQDEKIAIEQLVERIVGRGAEQIKQLQEMGCSPSLRQYVSYYNENNEDGETSSQLPLVTLEYFMANGDQFMEVYRDAAQKDRFAGVDKYREFQSWKGSNEWEIQVQGELQQRTEVADRSTVIQNREFRQLLLYDLNQLLFFFKATKHELLTAEKGLGFETQAAGRTTMVEGEIEKAITDVQKVISHLTSKRLITPLELKTSKKAYQLLVSQFLGYEANIATMRSQIQIYNGQIVELGQKREQEVEKLNFLRGKVARCRPVCQSLLGEVVKREVKITGEINKLE